MAAGNALAAAPVLSQRGERMGTPNSDQDMLPDGFLKAYTNPFSKENFQGLINMGTACNSLVHDIIQERLSRQEGLKVTSKMMNYGTPLELREATAAYLNREIHPRVPLTQDNIVITNGVTGGIDCLMHLICDPGDAVLVATPYYGMFAADCGRMAEAKLIHVDTYSSSNSGPFRPSIEQYKRKFRESTEKGFRVRAILVTNPHNPVGFILSREELEELVQFCHKNSLHLIMDEVYMRSILDPSAVFTSVLELELPNPDFVHVAWGYSKDFAVPGFSIGCLVCPGSAVPRAAQQILYYYATSSISQHLMTTIVKDTDWLANVYFPKQSELLRAALKIVTVALDSVGVEYITPQAGLFIMVDLRKCVMTAQDEVDMYTECLVAGLYVSPGSAFFTAERGWFRIIFSIPLEDLKVGMERFCAVIERNPRHITIRT